MRRASPFAVLAALALALAARPAGSQEPADPVDLAGTGALNSHVLAVVRDYPLDGSHGYHWPRSGSWAGTTRDVVYAGRTLAEGDPDGRSYCCGLTFEVYVRALLRATEGRPVRGVTADDLHELRLRFFGDSDEGERRRLVQFALDSLELGRAVESLEDARAGDFVQLWREGGSGHQAVFVNWLWDDGEIVGLTYWSSQSSTRGIGYRSERFAGHGGSVKPDAVHVGRAGFFGGG